MSSALTTSLTGLVLFALAAPSPCAGDNTSTTADSNAAALYEQAKEAMQAGQCDRAIRFLEAAVQKQPQHVGYRTLLAEAFERVGRTVQAATQLARIGDLHLAKDKLALAAQAYERALALDGANAESHFKLATAYFKLKQFLGRVTSRQVGSGSPGQMDGEYFLLEPEPGRANTFRVAPATSAVFQVHKAIELGLDTPEVHRLRGDIWLQLRQYKKALEVFRSIDGHIEPPNRASFEYSLAQAALGVDDIETYLDRLKRAAELDPSAYAPRLVNGYRTAAERCNQRGDLAGYVCYLEAALKGSPNSPDLHHQLGNAYWEAGRRTDAAREWQITLELAPDHPRRADMLDRIRTTTGS